MVLNKAQKIILGIFTFLPFVVFPFMLWQVFVGMGNIFSGSESGHPSNGEIAMEFFAFLFPIGMLAFGSLVLLIFYIIHAVMNKSLNAAEQVLWILLFVFLGIIVFPVYWVMRVWNNSNNP